MQEQVLHSHQMGYGGYGAWAALRHTFTQHSARRREFDPRIRRKKVVVHGMLAVPPLYKNAPDAPNLHEKTNWLHAVNELHLKLIASRRVDALKEAFG